MPLTDTQLIVLSAASQRDRHHVLPLPKSLKGGAATKVISGLMTRGLIEEVNAKPGEPRWKEPENSSPTTLVLTETGLAALDGDTAATGARKDKGRQKSGKAPKAHHAPRQRLRAAKEVKTRADTKQAKLIAMLKRPNGASIEEIVAAFGWQPHTVRGAISGALKKKLGLDIASESVEGRGRIYRISSGD